MNAFFGYVIFQNSDNLSEKEKHFIDNVFSAFPNRFPHRKIFSLKNINFSGDFESFYSGNEADTECNALFLHGEIYNSGEIEHTAGISSAINNAHLVYELIRQKGLEAIQTINGQFIIIYFDQLQNKVYFLNDHLGIKQLFYYQNKNILLFGSEIKFLLAHPDCSKEIDWETSLKRPHPNGLYCFTSYKTWFKDIYLLPEANILQLNIENKELSLKPYWNQNEFANYNYQSDKRSADTVMEQYIALLEDAVKIRLNPSTTNYALLSGGLDSSAVAALSAKYSPTETFSIISQTTFLEGTTDICNQLSNDLHFKNAQFLIPTHEIFFNVDIWKRLIWRMESPVNHTDALTKTLLHYAIKNNSPQAKAILTGTGSDQFNGGLARYILRNGGIAEESWETFHNEIINVENQKLISRTNSAFWNRRRFINRDYLVDISESKNEIEKNYWMFYVKAVLHSEVFSLCWDEVRASNYHGHETRFPFLDFRFMEFIAKIPPHLHKDLFFDKTILRQPLKNVLPEYVINKPKAPYYHPDYNYYTKLYNFIAGNKDFIEETLGSLDQSHPVLNKKAIFDTIKLLKDKPNTIDWENIINILNLLTLEKLAGKNDAQMDMEALSGQVEEVKFDSVENTKIYLEDKLSIKSKEIDLKKPLKFCDNCSLLFDKLSYKFFLSRNNELVFEIEDEYVNWKTFLIEIDNKKSVQQIIDQLAISYSTIEEFLKIAIEEKILIVN